MNLYRGPSLTHYRLEFNPQNLLRCWEECKAKSEYAARRAAILQFNQQNRWKKRGMAFVPVKYGVGFGAGFLGQVRGESILPSYSKHTC